MAKSKHQKLANLLQEMLQDIEIHKRKVAKALNLVQFYFYEKKIIAGRPLMKRPAIRRMMFSHYIGLQHLAPAESFRQLLKSTPMFGSIIDQPLLVKSSIISRITLGWFVPWGIQIVYPKDSTEKLEQSKLRALLICPTKDEISCEIDWFEEEDASDSLTHQILIIKEYEKRMTLIRENLLSDPLPLWEEAKEAWLEDPYIDDGFETVYDAPCNPKNVDEIDFAPRAGLSLALAYEKVLLSTRTRRSKHRYFLRQIYKNKIEQAIFQDVAWSEVEQKAFLEQWKVNFFDENRAPSKSKPGRWEQCEAIDRYTAARFIRYFINKFIMNPNDKKMGEIACVLWLLIWIAHQDISDKVTIKDVLSICSTDLVADDRTIFLGSLEIDISWGLHGLLHCLVGKGKGVRARRLFENLDEDGKTLGRALLEASKDVLESESTSVSAGAFLAFPHQYPGQRISAIDRKAMRQVPRIIPLRNTRRDIKKLLCEASKRRA